MEEPTWTILVPTLGERRELFERMIWPLLHQTGPGGGRVKVVGYWNNGLPRLPAIRQRMIETTGTEYLCFVDDDDLVSHQYVDRIARALAERPDYVGFQVQCYSSGNPTAISYHSLEHRGWRNEATAYYRDISHVNPIRTTLARLGDFRAARPGRAEDRAWVDQLRASGRVRNQVMIDEIMYHYLYEPKASAWQRPNRIRRGPFRRPEIDHPNFTWHPECPRG